MNKKIEDGEKEREGKQFKEKIIGEPYVKEHMVEDLKLENPINLIESYSKDNNDKEDLIQDSVNDSQKKIGEQIITNEELIDNSLTIKLHLSCFFFSFCFFFLIYS
jgi:hypothetical protein